MSQFIFTAHSAFAIRSKVFIYEWICSNDQLPAMKRGRIIRAILCGVIIGIGLASPSRSPAAGTGIESLRLQEALAR
ncbi:MAG: hypothetical protein ACQKBT_09655, partial [Puniceicoccales bacterium]